jgi:thiol-disulfide isomerase/thioredoxin
LTLGREAWPSFARRGSSSRRRSLLAIVLALAVVGVVVLGVLAVVLSPSAPRRAATVPAADRAASPALRRAAAAVGFSPLGRSGVGQIENRPAADALTPETPYLLPVGSQAPEFTLRTPVGQAVSLREQRGKAVLLEFFATWCPHCAAEAPHLGKLARSLPRSMFAFLSVDASSGDAPSVYAYHVYFGLPFPALLDPSSRPVTFPAHGAVGPVSNRYRVAVYPTFYVLDPKGRIAWRADGEQPTALLRQELVRAAGQPVANKLSRG